MREDASRQRGGRHTQRGLLIHRIINQRTQQTNVPTGEDRNYVYEKESDLRTGFNNRKYIVADGLCPNANAHQKQARVQLGCTITKGGDVQSRVKVNNTSNYAIPAGTKINVQIAGASLPNLLQNLLAKGDSRDLYGPADHGGGCKAQATIVVTN